MSMTVEKRIEVEKKIVRKTIRLMKDAGWNVVGHNATNDESFEACSGEKETIEAVFSVDEAKVYFKKGDLRRQVVFFVMGNDGWDVVCDYTAPMEGTPEHEFVLVMDAVQEYANKLASDC